MKKYLVVLASLLSLTLHAEKGDSIGSIIDEVIWVVGDEPILKSEVEVERIRSAMEGVRWGRNPDCAIPEQIAVQKLFLNQAELDSIEVTDAEVAGQVERYIEHMVQQIGSMEKLEEYRKQSMTQIRASMRNDLRNQLITQRMREHLVKDITVTPAEVRRYFKDLPADSIPYVPTTVEVQIITQMPRIDMAEINRVKEELRDYTDRVNKGEASFQTLARLYSEDPSSARYGGEMDYVGRGILDPAFANVAFNLTDPKKISKIVESEFGFHIIQLVDKRGDKIKVRHILRKPVVSDSAIAASVQRLDTIADCIRKGTIPPMLAGVYNGVFDFENAVSIFSDDKDTRNNRGLMANLREEDRSQTSRFSMQELPAEVAKAVDTLEVGEISRPFTMINKTGKTVCAIAKLRKRIDGHKATVTDDFQVLKEVVLNKRRSEAIHEWVVNKIKNTYVRLNENYRDCDFEFEGWVR